MRWILLLSLAIVTAYGFLQINEVFPNNYVKMYLGGYVVELKILPFLLLALLALLLLNIIVWLFKTSWRLPTSLADWRRRRNQVIAENKLGAGYLSLIKGDWKQAEKQLTTKSQHCPISHVNYLAAAQAAQEQGALAKRDKYLSQAYQAAPKERLAIGLSKARLHQTAGQFELAQVTLDDIREVSKNNPQYVAMQVQLAKQSSDWQQVKALLPLASKKKALPTEMLSELDAWAARASLENADNPETVYNSLSKQHKADPDLIAIYARHLVSSQKQQLAEKVIRGALKSHWSPELVELYSTLEVAKPKPEKRLRMLEGLLMARPESGILNLAAARVAKYAGKMDLAKQYYQAAISAERLPQAYGELAQIFEQMEDSAGALDLYREGIQANRQLTSPALMVEVSDGSGSVGE